jgi:hypothetical protein
MGSRALEPISPRPTTPWSLFEALTVPTRLSTAWVSQTLYRRDSTLVALQGTSRTDNQHLPVIAVLHFDDLERVATAMNDPVTRLPVGNTEADVAEPSSGLIDELARRHLLLLPGAGRSPRSLLRRLARRPGDSSNPWV